MTRQPKWKVIANWGDADPLEYGGKFVYVDKTGVYPPEMEVYQPEAGLAYRFPIERMQCSGMGHLWDGSTPAWFDDSLDDVAKYSGVSRDELIRQLSSYAVSIRADGYVSLGEYYGWDEFDPDPLSLTPAEAAERYRQDIEALEKVSGDKFEEVYE